MTTESGSEDATPAGAAGHPRRVLVVAAEAIKGAEVRDEIAKRARGGSEIRVVAPALTESRFQHHAGAVDDARERAEERLRESLEELSGAGVEAGGEVGDTDLRLAIQDALQTFVADEIVIVAHRDDPPPMEPQGIAEAELSFEPPITELFVTHDGAAPHVAEVEHSERGGGERDPDEIRSRSRNMPPYSLFDIASILVAIVGTGALVVLAANCGDDANLQGGLGGTSGFGGCEIRLLLAGLAGLVNLAHVVGLMLFQAGPYRGSFRPFFAVLSLVGTPVAVLVSLLVG